MAEEEKVVTLKAEDVEYLKRGFNFLKNENAELKKENDDLKYEVEELKEQLEPQPLDIDLSEVKMMLVEETAPDNDGFGSHTDLENMVGNN